MTRDRPGSTIARSIANLKRLLPSHEFESAGFVTERKISMSAGIVSSPPGEIANLEELYRGADRALYQEKHDRPSRLKETEALARTGTWKL